MTETPAPQFDSNGDELTVGQVVQIGKGAARWTVRFPRPDLGQVGLVQVGLVQIRPNATGSKNRYIEPERVTIVK